MTVTTIGTFGAIKPLLTVLHESKILADLTFVCSDGHLKAHKLVVGAQSKFLKQAIRDTESGEEAVIHLPNVNKDHMEVALKFLYHGVLKLRKRSLPVLKELLFNVLQIDASFNIPDLDGTSSSKKAKPGKDDDFNPGSSGNERGPTMKRPWENGSGNSSNSSDEKRSRSSGSGNRDRSNTRGPTDAANTMPMTPPHEMEEVHDVNIFLREEQALAKNLSLLTPCTEEKSENRDKRLSSSSEDGRNAIQTLQNISNQVVEDIRNESKLESQDAGSDKENTDTGDNSSQAEETVGSQDVRSSKANEDEQHDLTEDEMEVLNLSENSGSDDEPVIVGEDTSSSKPIVPSILPIKKRNLYDSANLASPKLPSVNHDDVAVAPGIISKRPSGSNSLQYFAKKSTGAGPVAAKSTLGNQVAVKRTSAGPMAVKSTSGAPTARKRARKVVQPKRTSQLER